MYSTLFCGTLKISPQNSQQSIDDFGFKIYQIELLKYHELAPDLLIFLSSQEIKRSNAYHFRKDKNRFIICRTMLKLLLAEYLGLHVNEITIEVDSNKKPYLPSHTSVFFNVSHAGDYALISIAKCAVGVDIEYINKKFEFKEVLPHIFSKLEIDEIEKCDDKHLAFYRLWTRKESVVKAIGKGIDDDVCKIPVTDGLHSVASSLVCDYHTINTFGFTINENYVGTLTLTKNLKNYDKIVFSSVPTPEEMKLLIQ